MNPKREKALYHTIVITNEKPKNTFKFETALDNVIRTQFGGESVYIVYKHGVKTKINDLTQCLKLVDEEFGDIGNASFAIKKRTFKEIQAVIMSWKNQHRNLYNLNLNQ